MNAFLPDQTNASLSVRKKSGLRVLIADDSNELRRRLVDMFSEISGVDQVAEAASATETLIQVDDFKPDLLILDLRMGDGSGIDVLRNMHRKDGAPKVIIFTNHPEHQYRRECVELGADYFLSKSIDATKLIEIAGEMAAGSTFNSAPPAAKAKSGAAAAQNPFIVPTEASFTCDFSGNLTSSNYSCHQLLGYSREETLAQNLNLLVAPEYAPIVADMLQLKAGSHLSTKHEMEIINKWGARVFIELSAATMVQDGQPIGVKFQARDITVQKRVDEAVQDAAEQYRLLFNTVPHPVWISAAQDGAFLAVNDATLQQYGYSRDQFLTMTLDDIHISVERGRLMDRMRLIKGSCHLGEWYQRRQDGSPVRVELTASLTTFNGRRAVLFFAQDVMGQRIIEETLRETQKQLLHSQKVELVGQLASGAAHDFNNLITAIAGYTELSLKAIREQPLIRHNLEEIKKAVDSAALVTGQLLAFTRKQKPEPRPLNLNNLIEHTQKMLDRVLGSRIELKTDLAADLGDVKADPGQLQQVVMNLVINARDAIPAAGRVVVATKNVTLDDHDMGWELPARPGRYILLTVRDTGHGMDRETRSHIFEPFFTTKELGKGTGLGLSTVYQVVKQTGGQIQVDSEPGAGTMFKVWLPRSEGADTGVAGTESSSNYAC